MSVDHHTDSIDVRVSLVSFSACTPELGLNYEAFFGNLITSQKDLSRTDVGLWNLFEKPTNSKRFTAVAAVFEFKLCQVKPSSVTPHLSTDLAFRRQSTADQPDLRCGFAGLSQASLLVQLVDRGNRLIRVDLVRMLAKENSRMANANISSVNPLHMRNF